MIEQAIGNVGASSQGGVRRRGLLLGQGQLTA